MAHRVRSIEITKIEPNCRCVYDVDSIDAMIRSIRQNGQIKAIKGSPTWVRKISSPPLKEGGPKFYADPDPEQAVSEFLKILLEHDPFTFHRLNP